MTTAEAAVVVAAAVVVVTLESTFSTMTGQKGL
jgi:hypothetical protein